MTSQIVTKRESYNSMVVWTLMVKMSTIKEVLLSLIAHWIIVWKNWGRVHLMVIHLNFRPSNPEIMGSFLKILRLIIWVFLFLLRNITIKIEIILLFGWKQIRKGKLFLMIKLIKKRKIINRHLTNISKRKKVNH